MNSKKEEQESLLYGSIHLRLTRSRLSLNFLSDFRQAVRYHGSV